VQDQTILDKKRLGERAPAARFDELAIVDDPAKHKELLRCTSLIVILRKAQTMG
jgi:hypothetical protein